MHLLSIPRIHRRVLGTWISLLLLLNLIFLSTGEDTSTTGLVPLLSTIPLVISNGAMAFLLPEIILSSTTPAPASPRHSAPVLASHWIEPPKGRWSISYVTGHDEETLYNIAIRRPLNGTAKLVTRTIVTYIDPDDFAASPLSKGSDAAIETQVYGTPVSLGLIGFPALELGLQVDVLQPRATLAETDSFLTSLFKTNQKRACLSKLFAPFLDSNLNNSAVINQDSHPVAPRFGSFALGGISPAAERLLSVIEPWVTEVSTSAKVFEECGILGVLAMVLLIIVTCIVIACFKVLVFCSRTQRAINTLVSLYHAALVQVRAWAFGIRFGYEWVVTFATTLFCTADLPTPEYIPHRLLTLEDSLAFRRARGLPLDWSPSSSTDSSSLASPPGELSGSGLDSEFNMNFDRIIKAHEERVNRDKNPDADPPFLSPAWAERLRAGTLSTQTAPASPPMVKTTPRSRSYRGPFAYDSVQQRAPERRTMPPLEIGSGASTVSPSSTNGLSTLLPNPIPTLAPTTSLATPSTAIVKSVSNDVEKNAQDSTPAPEPSEPNKSDVDLAAQVSGTTSYARFIGTSRLDVDVSSLPAALANVQTTTTKKDSRDSKPSEPHHSVTDLAAQVSGTVSYARFLGTSSFEVSSRALEGGSPNTTKKASRAPKPSKRNVADADLTAQVSGTASKASLLAQTGLDQKAALASSRHEMVVSQPRLNVVEEIRRKSRSGVRGGIAQRPDTLQGPIEEDLPISKENREARLNVKPIRKRRQGARKTARKEEEQSEGESGMDWVPTPTPAPVIAWSTGEDVIMQDFSISQQQRAMEESKGTAANLPPNGAGTRQALEQLQAPIPMDMDVEMVPLSQAPILMDVDVGMVPFSLPQPSLQSDATPLGFKWQSQVRREHYGVAYQRRYFRRRTACFGL